MRSAPPLTREHWSLLGLLGLTLQINHYDFALLTLALPQIQAGLAIPEDRIGSLVASVRLGVLPAFALAFLADRAGRRRLLVVTILGFTLCTAATAFARDAAQFLDLPVPRAHVHRRRGDARDRGADRGARRARRAASGSASSPPSARSASARAALALALVNVLPFGWRALYLVGAVPLLWIAWLRRRVPETRRFAAEREARREQTGLAASLRPLRDLVFLYPRRMLALCAALIPAAFVAITGSTFVSKYLQDTQGWQPGQVTLLYGIAGALVFGSTVAAGTLADRFGRRA